MNQKLILSKEQIELLNIGTKLRLDSTYYYLPFWFKATEEEGVFECFSLEHLPKELVDYLPKMRNYERRGDRSEQ